jgi:hypothetical protein
MDLKKIEILLQKYYDGETTLEEENVLKAFFASGDVPDHLKAEEEMFTYYHHPSTDEMPAEGMEEKILDAIGYEDNQNRKQSGKKSIYLITSIAASFLILLGSYFLFLNNDKIGFPLKKYQDTFDNPELAYLETKKTLLFISEKLNIGTKELQTISTFNKTVKELSNLSKVNYGTESLYTFSLFGTGVRELENLSEFDKAKEKITKKSLKK